MHLLEYDKPNNAPFLNEAMVSPTIVIPLPLPPRWPSGTTTSSDSVSLVAGASRKLKGILNKRFVLSLLAGQLASLCLTCTDVTTTNLVARHMRLPGTQIFFLYFSLLAIYTPYTIYKYGFKGWAEMVRRDGWKYLILAASDVEANFLVVTAFQHTDLLSCMLINTMAIPACMLFSRLYSKTKYTWTQVLGIMICLGGLGMLVISDKSTGKNNRASSKAKGDALMFAGAVLYGFTNATEEYLVRQKPLYEVVGQLGLWGAIIGGSQALGLELEKIKRASWNPTNIGLLAAFTTALFILYTVAPLLYRLTSSTYYNLSLISSNFYGLLFGLFLFRFKPYWLYFVAFAVVVGGLTTFFVVSPEDQETVDLDALQYVQRRTSTKAEVPDV